MTELLVADIAALLEEWYPPSLAEDWDVVGLTVGAPDATVTRIQLAVEPTLAVIDEAARAGADLLITHHPLLLRGVDRVRFDSPKGALIEAMIRARIALFVAHTNADSGVGGVVDCLADALGLSGCEPLAPARRAVDKLVTYVPESHVDAVVDALAEAGAGRIGSYERCAFGAPGTGTFGRCPEPPRTSVGSVRSSTCPRCGSRWCSPGDCAGQRSRRCSPPTRTTYRRGI